MSYRDTAPVHVIVKEEDGKQYDANGTVICVWNTEEGWWEPLPEYEYDTIDYSQLI